MTAQVKEGRRTEPPVLGAGVFPVAFSARECASTIGSLSTSATGGRVDILSDLMHVALGGQPGVDVQKLLGPLGGQEPYRAGGTGGSRSPSTALLVPPPRPGERRPGRRESLSSAVAVLSAWRSSARVVLWSRPDGC
jgi:hypothetical protein